MPRPRASAAAAAVPASSSRVSPRKRKQADELSTSTHPPRSAETDVQSRKRTRKNASIDYRENSAYLIDGERAISSTGKTSKSTKNSLDANATAADTKPQAKRIGKTKIPQAKSAKQVKIETEAQDDSKTTIVSAAEEVIVEPKEESKPEKTIRKRKTKEEKEADAMPRAARATGLKMFVGAHVSIAKGLENAITNSVHIGANAFALFLKSQRKWETPTLKDENRTAFMHNCTNHKYDQSSHVVPHGSYLVNLASPNEDMSKKSYDGFVDDLHRCDALGIKYYNFHPGSTNKEPLNEAIGRLAGNLNRALAETKHVVPLLENMAGHGSIIGSRFSDLRDIIAAIKPEFRNRIGVCIDTCHTFAAGYDLRTPQAYSKTLQELDETVGLKYLKAMHINDSKAPFGSHRDLHQNIGVGFLGLRAFHNVMNDSRLENIPLILETPGDDDAYAREIKLLESLIGMDPESDEFKQLETDLSKKGRAEREKMESSINVRDEKARKKTQRELEKGQKNISSMFSGKAKKKEMGVSSNSDLSDEDSDT